MTFIRGNTTGVGSDIIEFLTSVGKYFDLTIVVTSGFRNGDSQARAMFENWVMLQRGKVYSKKVLPEKDRELLDGYYRTCHENQKSTIAERRVAKTKFMALAKQRGATSKHTKGRAVDISQSCLTLAAYQAITTKMRAVREGKRRDIYHFECDFPISRVTEAEMRSWGATGSAAMLSSANAIASIGTGCEACGA